MLEIQRLREQTDLAIQGLKNRNIPDAAELVHGLIQQDDDRKQAITELEVVRREMNQVSKSIGQLLKSGDKAAAAEAKKTATSMRERIKELEKHVQDIEQRLENSLLTLPNIPHESVPAGRNEQDNVVVRHHEKTVTFDFDALPHWELATRHNLISWELGVKLTGSGFPVYIGKGAQLQRALIGYFLSRAAAEGYTEIQPPLVINEASGLGTGQLPDKEGQMYHIEKDGLYLIPTAALLLQKTSRPLHPCTKNSLRPLVTGSGKLS